LVDAVANGAKNEKGPVANENIDTTHYVITRIRRLVNAVEEEDYSTYCHYGECYHSE
jgi:hypothetical protein